MAAQIPAEALQLRSLVRADQTLELSLDTVPVPEPGPNEVLIRIEAAPINPSDLGLLFAGADMTQVSQRGTKELPVVAARIPDGVVSPRGIEARERAFGEQVIGWLSCLAKTGIGPAPAIGPPVKIAR